MPKDSKTMDNRDARIHSDHQVNSFEGLLSASRLRLCEERGQINEQDLDGALPCSDSDQFSRDELSTSDKLNIGGAFKLSGFRSCPSAFESGEDGACENYRNHVHLGRRESPVQANLPQGRGIEPVAQAPRKVQGPVISDIFSAPKLPPSCVECPGTLSARYQGDHSASGGVGTLCHTVSPVIETMASGAMFTCKRDSATTSEFVLQDAADSSHNSLSRSQSAENTDHLLPPAVLHTGAFIHNTEDSNEIPKVPQPIICVGDAVLSSENEHIAKSPPCQISLQTASVVVDVATREGQLKSSLSVVGLSSEKTEIHVSSSSMSRSEPTLASPVLLGAKSIAQSTPPTSPLKLSSPPYLKPAQKVNNIHTKGLGASFRNPWAGPIRCGLSTIMSPLPPSSPPPMLPSSPPTKRPRVDSDSEDQPRSKVRRTGQLISSPFVSPLRNAQGARARPPAGGFSTPLRPSTIRLENFSSPILPSQPDVFTTPATAARSSPAYRPAATLESSPATSASTTYKLRPPRTVTRPFKPPARSNRPTTTTIQALRQRLQLLRNALRIRGLADPTRPVATQPVKTTCNDEELEALALRWRAAAQEAAHDLWALVRDNLDGASWGSDSGRVSKADRWGWSNQPQYASTRLDNANTETQGLDGVGSLDMFTPPPTDKVHRSLLNNLNRPFVPRNTLLPPCEIDSAARVPAEDEELAEKQEGDRPKYHTLGTLLTSLGIPHEILGWQEDEGEFVN
ncbi:hypothetical protein OPQ81_004726 [Rhizoctonia solani]|nr:hypothetical protein OPQ81_004726 [Rhizoctonia solani]